MIKPPVNNQQVPVGILYDKFTAYMSSRDLFSEAKSLSAR